MDRSLSYAPVFQTFIHYRQTGAQHWRLSALDVEIETFDFDSGLCPFDLTLELIETPEEIQCRLQYNTDLFQESTATRFLKRFEGLLGAIIANPSLPISELLLLTAGEREQLLFEWNQPQVEFPGSCVHQLFESQAVKTPRRQLCCADRSA